ncbi:MAG TPA: 16S rRNA (cytosine(1402)-N(4))-methyltransferase RsmH [Bacteroidales bacterium]|nr:16S rRNA (cytosine(1402)-N(4))-methyltransferase RsmH [Bacteroidales bacterium]
MDYHCPVMLKECIDGLNINPKGIYVDVTFGGGGHSQEILKNITTGRLIAFDQDEEAIQNRIEDDRFLLLNQNFRYLKNFLRLYNALPVDGIIADLGVSSHQIDSPERGFSTRFDGELDLRMDKRKKLTARYVVNKYTENQLKLLFSQYGEVRNASKLANTIIHFRNEKEINSTATLKEAMATCIDKRTENKYLAQVFQALRIEVNSEMDALKDLLIQAGEVLKPGGRLVVMSYHSLEDRLVKNFFKAGNFEGVVKKDFFGNPMTPFRLINRKPIVASQDELNENNRARSSKLRIAEKY